LVIQKKLTLFASFLIISDAILKNLQ